jgi:hypothetical protein
MLVKVAGNESVFAMAGYSVFDHAGTEVDIVLLLSLIINVQHELKLIKVLLLIALPSSPAIANTFVVRSCFSVGANYP